MTGIVGIIAHDRRLAVPDAEISGLADAYEAVRGTGERHRVSAGTHTRMIKIDTAIAAHPGIAQGGDGWTAVTGVIHHQGSLLDAQIRDLDGQFALVRYDRRADELLVASDPFGMHALYVAERDGKTYISSSALALARHLRAQPNLLALSMLLRCGKQLGPLTNWQGIERLDPATALSFTTEGCRRSIYWRLEVDEMVERMRFEQAVDHAIEVLTETFRRTFAKQPRVWADLTGGFDSRMLLLFLRRAGVDFRANTVGEQCHVDVRIAHRIAAVTGQNWSRFRVPEHWPDVAPAYLNLALAWVDGRLPILHLAEVLWVHERQSLSYQTLLTGGGGEAYRSYGWWTEIHGIGRHAPVNYDNLIRMKLMSPQMGLRVAPGVSAEVADYLRSWLMARAQPYASTLNTTQLHVLLADRLAAWDGIFASAAGMSLRSELPFLLKPAYATGFSINFRFRKSHQLMRAIIERLDSRVAALPTTSGGPAQPRRLNNLHRFAPYYARNVRAGAAKMNQKTFGHSWPARGGAEDPRVAAGRQAVLAHLALRPDTMRSARFFERQALDTFLRDAAMPHFSRGEMLGRLLTVEMALRATEAT